MEEYTVMNYFSEIAFNFIYIGTLLSIPLRNSFFYLKRKREISLESKLDRE